MIIFGVASGPNELESKFPLRPRVLRNPPGIVDYTLGIFCVFFGDENRDNQSMKRDIFDFHTLR